MSEVIKDSATKLCGQTISLPSPPHKAVSEVSLSQHTKLISQDSEEEKTTSSEISDEATCCNNNKNSLVPQAFLISSPLLSFYPYDGGPVLGKNLREKNADGERSVKLRIHDQSEAAKSSFLWCRMNETSGAAVFDDRAAVLQANPAALCRSLNFHETI